MSLGVPSDFTEDSHLCLDLNDSANTDVYLIRVPKGFDVTVLDGTEFSTNEIQDIGVEEGTNQLTSFYELGAFGGQGLDVSPLIKSGETYTLGPAMKGFLSVNKSYRTNFTSSFVSHRIERAGQVPLPEGLRVRFKPFGAGTPFKQPLKKKRKKRQRSLYVSSSEETLSTLHTSKKQKTHNETDSFRYSHKKLNKRNTS